MSTTATVVAIGRILEVATTAIQVGLELQKRAMQIQQLHAAGQTLSDDELSAHLAETQAAVDKLKALTGGNAP